VNARKSPLLCSLVRGYPLLIESEQTADIRNSTFLAYIYPSHTTFHALQSPEKLDKQLEIWTVIGIYTILRHIIDTLLGWIPGYDIATIALLAWCVAPQTQGASWIYQRFVRGWSAQHQTQIDTLANTFKTRAGTEVSKWANRLFVKVGEAFTQVIVLLLSHK